MSFSQALSGLNAQQQKLGVLGNNIANSQTVGFKSSGVQFADVFANSQVGLGTRVSAVLQNFSEGNIESTNRNLDLAISGTGFYRFEQGGEVVYSRNGQLSLTTDGLLQNAQGANLMGYGLNAQGQVQVGGQPQVLQVNAEDMPAGATTNVATTFNLDSRMGADGGRSIAEVINSTTGASEEIAYHYSNNFTVYDSLGNPVNATVYYEKVGAPGNQNVWQAKVAADGEYSQENDFLMEFNANGTLIGLRDLTDEYRNAIPALEARESELAAAERQLEVAEETLVSAEATFANAEAERQALEDSGLAAGDSEYDDAVAARDAAALARDNAKALRDAAQTDRDTAMGNRDDAEAVLVAAYNGLPAGQQKAMTFDVDSGAEELTFNFNPAGSTQFGNTSTTNSLTQNGFTSGTLVGITIEDDGTIMRNYSNEQSRPSGQISLANFRNPEGLRPVGDNVWAATQASGQELVGAPGTGQLGLIVSGAIETSNVDMARELVDMIVAQRAYQANSQTIKTQDELLQTAINLR